LSNQDQNRQFRDAVRRIEEILGRYLTYKELDMLHREISGKGYSFEEIVNIGLGMFG
jgi:hypothetical protein